MITVARVAQRPHVPLRRDLAGLHLHRAHAGLLVVLPVGLLTKLPGSWLSCQSDEAADSCEENKDQVVLWE